MSILDSLEINQLKRQLLLKEIELITLKEDDFKHINVNKIDLDGIELLERMFYSIGEDGLKLWLLRLFPLPEIEYRKPRIRMLSEVLAELKLDLC
jgi:hypothetical protein